MLKALFNRAFGLAQNPSTAEVEETGSIQIKPVQPQQSVVHYPPQDPGFVCRDAKSLVASQGDLTSKLKLHAASTPAIFEDRFSGPIDRLATYIGNLPGSASGVFAGEGGLFRACLEMAFNCYRASDGRIFTGASGVEERHLLEGRWRYVCFAAGLLYPLGSPVQAMQVINEKGERWSPELDGLNEWLSVGQKYWASWSSEMIEPGPSALAGMLAHKVLGRKNIDWLNDGSPELIRRLVEISTGSPAASSLIANSVVKDVWSSIHERETARRHQNYGRLVVGSHVSPYVIDALVMLAQEKWVINQKTMFVDGTGVFLEWPVAGTDIIEYCKQRGFTGIPSSANALLSMMLTNKLVVGNVDGVEIVEIANSDGEIVGAIKLARPGLLIEDLTPYAKPGVRPISIQAVRAADPLTSPSPEQTPAKPKRTSKVGKSERSESDAPSRPKLDTLDINEHLSGNEGSDDDDDDDDDEAAAVEADAPNQTPESIAAKTEDAVVPQLHERNNKTPSSKAMNAEGTAGLSTASKPTATIKQGQQADFAEGEAVRYSDYVAKEIAEKLKPHALEVLGKVIHAWRLKSEPDYVMRMTSVGAAVEQDYIQKTSAKAIDAMLEWASIGILYIDPSRQGMKVHQIASVDGGQKKVGCVIFSTGAARTLGMN